MRLIPYLPDRKSTRTPRRIGMLVCLLAVVACRVPIAAAEERTGQDPRVVPAPPVPAQIAPFAPRDIKLDNHTLAVVPLDQGVEAVVVLDPVRFTLTGYVLNRFTGKFFARFYYEGLAADFGLAAVKDPRFTIMGGTVDFRGFSSNVVLADAVIYIAEHTTGKLAAYGLPWDRTYRTDPPAVAQFPFVPLDAANFRFPLPRPAVPGRTK